MDVVIAGLTLNVGEIVKLIAFCVGVKVGLLTGGEVLLKIGVGDFSPLSASRFPSLSSLAFELNITKGSEPVVII